MVIFMREERDTMLSTMDKQRQEVESLREELHEAKLREQALGARLREQAFERTLMETLQQRIHGLHKANLLTDDELFVLEDTIVDGLDADLAGDEGRDAGSTSLLDGAGSLAKMVALSQQVPADTMFARQLRRKFAA
jgi:hypothetical protein